MAQDTFEIKYVTGTKVYLDDSGETVITIAYVEIPDSHQPRIIGSFAASSSVAEAYCRQLMEVLGIKGEGMAEWARPERKLSHRHHNGITISNKSFIPVP